MKKQKREGSMNRPALLALWLGLFAAPALPAAALAQQPDNVVLNAQSLKQLTPHVWAIYGNPNIAIIVGAKATLVVDTGLGNRNGAFIAGEVLKLRKSPKLFLTTTHGHPEHAAGQDGFPADTVVIRPKVQQKEMEATGAGVIEIFRARDNTNKELLVDARIGKSDILFDDELTLDLGDVTARLSWFGPAHTNGDMLTFIEPDGVLVSGDVVQNKAGIGLSGSQSTIKSWLAVLDKVALLKPTLILPDHSPPGDASLITEQRAFLIDLQQQIQALKAQGKTAEEAGRLISADFKTRYAGWSRLMFLERSVTIAFKDAP
jgi:glyoxylase-like metal-dependent hydrolase (beta-lactamase superfamily II)